MIFHHKDAMQLLNTYVASDMSCLCWRLIIRSYQDPQRMPAEDLIETDPFNPPAVLGDTHRWHA